MNIDAVNIYLATQFSTYLKWYTPDGRLLEENTRRVDLADPLQEQHLLLKHLLSSAKTSVPFVCCVGMDVCYGLVRAENEVCLIGPVLIPGSRDLPDQISGVELPPDLLRSLAVHRLPDFMNGLVLLHNLLNDDTLTAAECSRRIGIDANLAALAGEQLSAALFDKRENLKRHNSYAHEQREMGSIEAGDLEGLKRSWENEYAGSLGTISDDPYQNGKYLSMIVIALASRAAIRGGVLPEQAFTAADVYLRKVETVRNPYHLDTIVKDAEYAFAQMAQAAKQNFTAAPGAADDPLLRQCRDHVFLHLHEKLTVREIAEQIGVHPNYLSTHFAQKEGISLYQFILQQKVQLAQTLLVYSDYGYEEIASYLGFASQSHLGATFKRLTGMTLRQYRGKYQNKWEDVEEL